MSVAVAAAPVLRPPVVVESLPAPQEVPPRWRHLPAVATVAIVLLGIGLRVASFATDRSLWIDEAMLALNIVDRSPAELLQPLDHNQGAPLGFLMLMKASVSLFGSSEWALRLVPFVASLLGLGLFGLAAFRLLPARAARSAVVLFAVSPEVISYAGEAKQYELDVAVCAGLLALVPITEERRATWRWVVLALAGAAAVWFSHPAVFVLGGLGTVLLVSPTRQRGREENPRWRVGLTLPLLWLGSFAALYFLSLRHLGGNNYLADFWTAHFLPRSLAAGPWLVDHVLALFSDTGGFGLGLMSAALAVLGCVALIRSDRGPVVGIVLGTVAVTLLASAVHKYPFGGRLLLFLVPLLVLLVAAGVAELYEKLHGVWRLAGVLLVAAVVLSPLMTAVDRVRKPPRAEELKPTLRYIREHWQAGDRLYVYGGSGDAGAGPAFDFYRRQFDFPTEAVVLGGVYRDDPTRYRDDVMQLPPGHVWLLVSHRHSDEESILRTHFGSVGEAGESVRFPGAAAYSYRIAPR